MFDIASLEQLMYRMSDLLLAPVLIAIVLLFIYSLFALGKFGGLHWHRKRHAKKYERQIDPTRYAPVRGYLIHNYQVSHPNAKQDELEVFALKRLESLRIVTRVAPMLGLIATMIPMGPALKSLGDGNIQGISENLVVAFSAVIWGLVTASLTYWPATVKKRWFAAELVKLQDNRSLLTAKVDETKA